jgi:hypothetical protein
MRTEPIKQLVNEVLDSLPKPYSEDIIDDVFHAIESSLVWLKEYQNLCANLGKDVVNQYGGHWIAHALGKSGGKQVTSVKTRLISSYSKLTANVKVINSKRKEAEALELMSAYYFQHKAELSKDTPLFRDYIVQLIKDGVSPEAAYAEVQPKIPAH